MLAIRAVSRYAVKQGCGEGVLCMSTRGYNMIRSVSQLQLLPLVAQHKVGHGSIEGRERKEETSQGFI